DLNRKFIALEEPCRLRDQRQKTPDTGYANAYFYRIHSLRLRDHGFLQRRVAGYARDAAARHAVDTGIPRAQQQQSSLAGVAQLIGLARFEHHRVELLEDKFFVRRAHSALAFEHHKNMVV